jgi:hypothetical protein
MTFKNEPSKILGVVVEVQIKTMVKQPDFNLASTVDT